MIQVYTDDVLAYDSRLESYKLLGLKATTALNKGGTAEIIMPPGHPAYEKYVSYRTLVEVYRDGALLFRGRALYPADDFDNIRTVTCEGELCFFGDAVSRPYLYQDTPAAIFAAVLETYNSQVESFKQFRLGEVTVTDPNDYVRLESEGAESVLDTINKLLIRCGGYIIFTTADDGTRVINWLESPGGLNEQAIEFGENLLSFARSGANTSLATGVLPYGAKDDSTGQRITIASVNNGLDYIVDDDAVALRGTIIKPVTWDDVTVPENLLGKARQWLEQNRYIITSLELTALDMSYLDSTITGYRVGDTIRVISEPHGVDDTFLLTERTENLLDPSDSSIKLGKDTRTLTDADVAGDINNLDALHKTSSEIKSEFKHNTAAIIRETETALLTMIQQTSEQIRLEVAETYTTNEKLDERISTSFTQLSDSFAFEFNELRRIVDENDAAAQNRFTEIYKWIRFEDGAIKLGSSDSNITLTIENDKIVFMKNGDRFGWWDGVDFHTGNIVVEVNERAQFGNFAWVPRSDGSLSLLKVGG